MNITSVLQALAPKAATITASFTRPSDTTAYAAGDAMMNSTSSPTVLTFSNVARRNGGGFILNRVVLHQNFKPSVVNLDVALYLFTVTPTAVPNDNAPVAWTNADNLKMHAPILIFGQTQALNLDIAATGTPVGETLIPSDVMNWLIKCDNADTNLYGVPVVLNASGYTPASAEAFQFDLIGYQD